MALGSVSAVSQAANLTGSSLKDFLQIMVTQLQYQDPMNAMSNTEFVSQMAQFAALEQTRALSSNIESLLNVQAASQSIGLIGRGVDVQTEQGAFSGKVIALDFRGGEPLLTVTFVGSSGASGSTASNIRLSQVIAVR